MTSDASPIRHEFSYFVLVGGIGFVVDVGLLLTLVERSGLPVLPARLVSFTVAVTVTWLLNRLMTFRCRASRRRFAEWRRYVAVNGIGGGINLGIFAMLAEPRLGLGVNPLVAFTIASATALIFNFVGSRMFAFREEAAPGARQEDSPPF